MRKNNIQIGDAMLLDKLFHEARGNHYFYGEVHVISPDIVPDSTRQGLAHTTETRRLYELLRDQFALMRQIYYMANEFKREVRDLGVSVAKMNSEDENVDKVEAKGEVEKALTAIEKTSSKGLATTPAGASLVDYYRQKSNNIQNNGGSDVPVDTVKTVKPGKTVKLVASDELSPLTPKYSVEAIKVIRKILMILRKKWDSGNKATLEKLITDIIKALK